MTTNPKPIPVAKLRWRFRIAYRSSLGDCHATFRFPTRTAAKKFARSLEPFWTVTGPTRIWR